MERQIAIVTGLGIGDEAKGTAVEWLTRELKAHTNIRSGGPQGGAHIVRSDGREQMFSQFGAGTFEGAKTHLVHMVVNPWELFNEAVELESKGIKDPLSLITIDSDNLILTPYHSAISRFKEIMREVKKGTVGMGIGEVMHDSKDPNLSIRASDMFLPKEALAAKIEAIRAKKYDEARDIIMSRPDRYFPEEAQAELRLLLNRSLVSETADIFSHFAKIAKVVDRTYLDEIINLPGSIVSESSQAILLGPRYGFVPHVTQVDPTGRTLLRTLRDLDYKGKILRLGVSRTYMIRHGAGPFVSYSPEMTRSLIEVHNSNPKDIPWAGEFKKGHYDILAMKYAIDSTGGPKAFDGLVISFIDEINKINEWQVCTAYEYTGELGDLGKYFFIENGIIKGIKVHPDNGGFDHLEHQTELTKRLKDCKPILSTLRSEPGKNLGDVFISFVESNLGVPVVVTADGPHAEDRHLRPGYENLLR